MKTLMTSLVACFALLGCSSAPEVSQQNATVLIDEFISSINNSHACSSGGFKACMNWRLSLAYPGSIDQTEAQKCIAARADDPKYKYMMVLADSTIQRDDEWVGPADNSPDWIFEGKSPDGQTYKADVTIAENYSGTDSTVVWSTHFTIMNGKVYWFPRIC